MKRKELYRGNDQGELSKVTVQIASNAHDLCYGDLALVRDHELSSDQLLYLFKNNGIEKNPIAGFNSKEGVSLYSVERDGYAIVLSLGEVNRGLFIVVLEACFAPDAEATYSLRAYKKISYSHDASIMGVAFPQISKAQKAPGELISKLQRARSVDQVDLGGLTFAAKLGTKITDFKSSAFLAYAGFFTSKEMADELLGFGEASNLKAVEISIQYTNDVLQARFLDIQCPQIDFENSGFVVSKNGELQKELNGAEIANLESLKSEAAKTVLNDIASKVVPRYLTARGEYALFALPASNSYLIRADVLAQLIKEGRTGFEVEEMNIPIFSASR